MKWRRNEVLDFSFIWFLEPTCNLRYIGHRSPRPSPKTMLSKMVYHNKEQTVHLACFCVSATRFHTSHGNRLCAEGPTAPVCVPLGVHTCLVSCESSPPTDMTMAWWKVRAEAQAHNGTYWLGTMSELAPTAGPAVIRDHQSVLRHSSFPCVLQHSALLLLLHTSIIITKWKWKDGIWRSMRLQNCEQLRNRLCYEIDCLDTMTKGDFVLLGQIYPNKIINKIRLANQLGWCIYVPLLIENSIEIAKWPIMGTSLTF